MPDHNVERYRSAQRADAVNARSMSWWVLIAVTALAAVVGLGWGSSGFVMPGNADSAMQRVVLELRLPRTVAAWLVGCLLGLAGAVAQGVFRNPLADPYLLGSASGAALGAVAALVLGAGAASSGAMLLGVTSASFVGAFGAVLLTLLLSRGASRPMTLLLAGIAVGVVLGGVREGLTIVAPETLRATQAFMLGSTAFVGWDGLGLMGAVGVGCLLVALGWAPAMDAMTLGDDAATSLGVSTLQARYALIAVLALSTAVAVSQAGLIAFVGLAAPHVARRAGHVRHRPHVVFATLAGGALLLVADVVARTVTPPTEWPVGLVTAIVGGSYLVWVLTRNQGTTLGPLR